MFLFNHLVRERNQPRWNGESERFGGLKIDHEFVFGRLKDRQIGRLRAFEDLSDVSARVSVGIRDTGSIADKTAIDRIFTKLINGGQFVLCRERNQSGHARVSKYGSDCNKQRADSAAGGATPNCALQFRVIAGSEYNEPLSDRLGSVL